MNSRDVAAVEGEPTIKVLYFEDDVRLGRMTTEYLTAHGLEVLLVSRGDVSIAEILRAHPDVVLLDLMLPGRDGVEVCRSIRERMDVPIIMVTARTEETDRVLGLESGADDYVPKPFSCRELLARIHAHARRARGRCGPRKTRLRVGSLVIDTISMSVTLDGRLLALTTLEFGMLRVLAERAGRVLTREQLLQLVHGSSEEAFDRSIDVHVSRLRHKLGDDPRSPRRLKTVRGIGYVLMSDEP